MTFSNEILNVAKTGLSAHQAVIATTANNISNVNTEGYTRRRVVLTERESQVGVLPVGRGVKADDVERLGDEFLERVLRSSVGESGAATVEEELLTRAQATFNISGDLDTIGSVMEEFFTSISDLTVSPADAELSQCVASGKSPYRQH